MAQKAGFWPANFNLDKFLLIIYTISQIRFFEKKEKNMKVSISGKSQSHGTIFILNLDGNCEADNKALRFLKRVLKPLIKGNYRNRSTLYVHSIELTPNGCSLQLVEQSKLRAQVDHRWNLESDDNKFTVLIVETCENEVPGHICT